MHSLCFIQHDVCCDPIISRKINVEPSSVQSEELASVGVSSLSKLKKMRLQLAGCMLLLFGRSWCTLAFVPHSMVAIARPQPSSSLARTTAISMIPNDDPSTFLLAATEAWVQPAIYFLDPSLNLMSFAMLARVVLSWYPDTQVKDLPWSLVVIPTEPFLKMVKGVVPPAFGVDITPVFWLAIFTFIHEILLGQQGLLTMKLKYGI